jgi:hypothetical protein
MRNLPTFHEFDHDGRHYAIVYDEDYQTRGSYAYDTEEETRAAEDEEIAKLQSGEWIVVGCIVTGPCRGLGDETGNSQAATDAHCECCCGTREVASMWGTVIENDSAKVEAYFREYFGNPV